MEGPPFCLTKSTSSFLLNDDSRILRDSSESDGMPLAFKRGFPFVALTLSIAFGIAGQLLLKWTAVHVLGAHWNFTSALQLGAALLIYSLGVLNWVLALRHLRLSVAYPVTSVSYVGILWGSYHWFGEAISLYRSLGVALIFFGVLLVVVGLRHGEQQ